MTLCTACRVPILGTFRDPIVHDLERGGALHAHCARGEVHRRRTPSGAVTTDVDALREDGAWALEGAH